MKLDKIIKLGSIKTSKIELIDITKAWIALSLAFTFIYAGASIINGNISKVLTVSFLMMFVISLFTAGLGFLLHELAHKFAAQYYGLTAEFRAFDQMLYLAMGLAVFIGFIFAAPGAVIISGLVTRKENGIISAAGPLTNYLLGIIFLVLLIFYPVVIKSINIWSIGFSINMWLGLFNMIPFGNLDGLKVFNWSKLVWILMVLTGIYFVFGF
ncbi:MAG TPA: metalloprotease [Candidatus Nanoarchaeia archaeon]|nr:metalloprotease [Candidatus Nanoarchaeia archaeon]